MRFRPFITIVPGPILQDIGAVLKAAGHFPTQEEIEVGVGVRFCYMKGTSLKMDEFTLRGCQNLATVGRGPFINLHDPLSQFFGRSHFFSRKFSDAICGDISCVQRIEDFGDVQVKKAKN